MRLRRQIKKTGSGICRRYACFGDDRRRELRQYLLDDATMGAAEPGRPRVGVHGRTLLDHERVEGDQRRQLARRDHRVRAVQASPEWGRAGFSRPSKGTGMEVATTCQPDILLAVEQRRDLMRRNRQSRRFRSDAGRFLHYWRQERQLQRGLECVLQGIGDRALMDMPQRRDIGIVARGNGNRVPDGEVVELPLRAQIALRLLRLAQPRQLQMERMTVISDQLMPGDERAHAPRTDLWTA